MLSCKLICDHSVYFLSPGVILSFQDHFSHASPIILCLSVSHLSFPFLAPIVFSLISFLLLKSVGAAERWPLGSSLPCERTERALIPVESARG